VRVAIAYTFDDRNWLGGRNYFSSLFQAIEAVAGDDIQIVLVTGRKTVTSLPEQFPRLEVIRTSILDRRTAGSVLRQVARFALGFARDPLLARLLRRHRIDVLSHSGGLGKGSGVTTLGWLPDFQFVQFPDYWTPRQLRATKRLYRSACMSCDGLILSSQSALADLNAFAPWCRLPKHVLHFIALPVKVDGLRSLESLREQYQLPADYFHLPNQFWAHKNHRVVVDALSLLKKQGVDVTVACTGQTTDVRRPKHFDGLMQHVNESGVGANFRVLGLVPYADMQALMLHARAVVNPSKFEGWSTTVEEAKALGKQTLLSDIPVHREQAPPGADYFPTDSPEALAALLRKWAAIKSPPPHSVDVERQYAERLRGFGRDYLSILKQH
jgi:glycosyltransferase involved in cell wall biosynthesis